MRQWIGLAAIAILAAGCASMTSTGPSATAVLDSTKNNTAAGKAEFVQKGDKVMVTVKVTGLSPGQHGFHIHEKGDCSSGDSMSAGGHFNPTNKPHGDPLAADHHTGDLPMLAADASGNASATFELAGMTIGSGATDIVGRGLIIHKDPDDFKTQPTGNSGARVACGVITRT
jgi:Cu-Zn family superoxide dismutase